MFIRGGESLQVAEGFPGVNPVQLLDIFCLVAKIPFNQKMENNSVVVASLRTILWYLIAHDDSKDLILTQTFLHAPTSMVSPTQIFQLLVELLNSKIEVSQTNAINTFQFYDIRRRVVEILKVWLEERFKRDFRSPLFSHLLLLLKELDPTESNFLKLILLRINKKKIQENGFNRFSLLMNPYAKTPRVHSRTIVGVVPNQQETKLMEWNVTSVAEQFTLIEVGLFKAIQLVELSNSAWKVANARKNSINVINILNRFDLVCQWASTEVVMAQSPKQRAAIIEKLILVAQKCYELRNYNALMEILAGLNRGSVQRLKQSWDGISSSSLATFKSLQEVVAVWNNYKTYRDTLRKSPLPCIPFFWCLLARYICVGIRKSGSCC